MLYLIGLGLNDEGDMPAKALTALKRCDEIYVELYTSAWKGDLGKLGKEVGKGIETVPREKVESEFLVKRAAQRTIALLIPGDPLTATTHIDLLLRSKKANVEVRVIHASSVYTAVAESGLQLYKFGRTTTVPHIEGGFLPTSPYEVIVQNKGTGLHTLVLLDIPMKVGEGLLTLLQMEDKLGFSAVTKSTKLVACMSLGSSVQKIIYASVDELLEAGLEDVPACLIVPGKLHFSEEEALEFYKI